MVVCPGTAILSEKVISQIAEVVPASSQVSEAETCWPPISVAKS
jgi:hypothetical protein